jgi:hypothetical protein
MVFGRFLRMEFHQHVDFQYIATRLQSLVMPALQRYNHAFSNYHNSQNSNNKKDFSTMATTNSQTSAMMPAELSLLTNENDNIPPFSSVSIALPSVPPLGE